MFPRMLNPWIPAILKQVVLDGGSTSRKTLLPGTSKLLPLANWYTMLGYSASAAGGETHMSSPIDDPSTRG